MSQSVRFEIIGEPAAAVAAFRKVSSQASSFGKTMDQQTKTVEKFHSRVTSLATTLLGAGGVVFGLESIIKASKDAQESTDHLTVTMRDAGLSYKDNQKQIESFIKTQSQLSAFQQTDLRESFGTIIRMTKDTGTAMKDEALAVDLARGRHIDLANATTIVIKAQEGMVGSLRRLGINIQPVHDAVNALTDSHKQFTAEQHQAAKAMDQQATAIKAIDELSRSYAGSAKAYGDSSAGAADKFKVSLTNLEIALGNAILPSINQLLQTLTPMIQKWVDSGKATRDMKTAMHDLGIVAHTVFGIFQGGEKVFQGFSDMVGGNRHAIELLTAAFVAFKLKGVASLVAGVGTAVKSLAGLTGAEEAAAGAGAGVGLGAIGAAGLAAGALGFAGYEAIKGGRTGKIGNQVVTANGLRGGIIPVGTTSTYNGPTNFGPSVTSGVSGLQGNALKSYIAMAAKSAGLDPAAVLAVASAEGGFGGAVGDTGTSFGPFQLHEGGALPAGLSGKAAAAYANSKQGIDYAIGKIAGVAKGLSGMNAVAAIVHGFERPADGGVGDISRAAKALGISTTAVRTAGDVPGNSSIGALVAAGKSKTVKPKVLSGAALLPQSLQQALARATASTGLSDDTSALQKAISYLKGQKQTTPVVKELSSLEKQLNGVDKTIADNLKAKAATIKTKFNTLIGADRGAITSAVNNLKTTLDTAFEAATQAYVDNVLSPKYFQGTDSSGNQLQTPSEALLAQMQAQDQLQQLQDAVAAAATPADQATAQRALDEYNLSIKATAERNQADHDYAEAVKEYQAQRTASEQAMNNQLDNFGKGLLTGTSKLSDLTGIVGEFGLSLSDPSAGLLPMFDDLSAAVQALSATFLTESGKLGGVGDKAGAKAAAAHAAALGGQGGTAISASAGYFLLNPIHMASGGSGTVNRPTLFLAGEAGKEQFAFSGGGQSFGGGVNVYLSMPNYVGAPSDVAKAVRSEFVKMTRNGSKLGFAGV